MSAKADPPPRRIAVFRALALGDMLCAVPALRALRHGFPDARIDLIGLPWSAELVRRFPAYLDGLVEFPGWPGIPEVPLDPRRLPGFLEEMQRRRYDLAIQLQGSGLLSNAFVETLGARRTAGAYLPGAWWRTDEPGFIPYPAGRHEIHRLLEVVEATGGRPVGDHLEFPVGPDDRAEIAALPGLGALVASSYAVMHPGAGATARRWQPERFAAVGDALAQRGLQVLLTGVASEAAVTAEVASRMRGPALDLAGRTSLGGLAALVDRARLVVSNDTGVAHLAVARAVPSVVVFLAADPDRWAPLDRRLHRVVGPGRASPCPRPDGVATCLLDACTRPERLHIVPEPPDVPVDAVMEAVAAQLGSADGSGGRGSGARRARSVSSPGVRPRAATARAATARAAAGRVAGGRAADRRTAGPGPSPARDG